MLYDNALLINVISEAYQLTQVDRYKNIIIETMGFVKRELCDKHGGFYSALDADSDGSEGKYYIWTYDEIQKILGDEMVNIFCKFYGVTQNGNWEHSNILHVKKSIKQFALDNNIAEENLTEIIKSGKKKLLKARQQRIKPGLDDKIILGWNALMNIACSKAFAATGDNEYLDLAILNMNFLLENFSKKDSKLFLHTFKNEAKYPAFLDDYVFLVAALIQLQQVSGNIEWLSKAIEMTETIIDYFGETETGYFFFTHKNQEDIIVRKKEVYDGAVPSGNAIMAFNLHYLSILLDRKEWGQRAEKMVSGLSQAIINYPSSFGVWAALIQEVTFGINEVAIVGEHQGVFLKEFLLKGFPHIINMTSNTSLDNFPLLRGKGEKGKTLIYLCRNFACLQPVYSVNELVKQVEDGFSKI
ncbi:MAG: thioredoxin domain-containing protein [Bacteroidetes bacterium]|nr:thioredoxin domain-containing protein [Bacteroidota bacterium]